MSATKAITANAEMTTAINNAILAALKAGLGKDEIAAYLTRMAETLESCDD